MNRKRILLLVLVMLIASLIMLTPAGATATRTPFTAMEATCSVAPGNVTISGNVLHIRGQTNTNRVISADATQTGTNSVVVNVDLDLVSGSGGAHGTFSLNPDAFSGTWEGSWSGPFTDFVFSGQAVGHGTGELAGKKVMVKLRDIDPSGLSENPCPGPAINASMVTGVVLDPQDE